MSVVLGLTGSIGMGKSTTAGLFRELDVPVWDADATVEELYGLGGAGVEQIHKIVPSAVKTGAVDRNALREAIRVRPDLLGEIEAAIHPLVAQSRDEFLAEYKSKPLILLDVPLLFEGGIDEICDYVVVVTIDPDEQRRRVLARGTTPEDFERLLARQMPDREKRERADFVIRTESVQQTRQAVADLVARLTTSR